MYHKVEVYQIFKKNYIFSTILIKLFKIFKARFPYEPFRRLGPLEYIKTSSNIIIDQVNYERVYSQSLRPIKRLDPKLYEVCQREAERSSDAGKLLEPSFNGLSANTMFISISIVGKTTLKDFTFSNDSKCLFSYYFFFELLEFDEAEFS